MKIKGIAAVGLVSATIALLAVPCADNETADVALSDLFSDPDQCNGKEIVLTGFYFDGFETTVLSERLEPTGFAEGHLWPQGRMVWIENNLILAEVYDQLYQQEMIGPLERYGKLRIRARFEHGGRYGHLGGFTAQIVPLEIELLPWSPAPQQPDYSITDLKYRLIEHFGGVLVREPVIVPEDVRREQARRALATIQQDDQEFQAILVQLGLERGSELTQEQQVLVFEEKKKLYAVLLEPTESGYSFLMMVREGGDPFEIRGVVEQAGKITVLTKEHALLPR